MSWSCLTFDKAHPRCAAQRALLRRRRAAPQMAVTLSGGAVAGPMLPALGISAPELACFLAFWAIQVGSSCGREGRDADGQSIHPLSACSDSGPRPSP